MLSLEAIYVYYGVIPAVRELSIHVESGRIVTLVGANGAGKTTTLKAVMGVLLPSQGSILYEKEDVTKLPADKRVAKGIALIPEGRQIFGRLSVKDNLILGAYHRKHKDEIRKDMDWIYSLFPLLKEREAQIAGTLSGGEQQMLAVGRGLMSHPRLLLLDEPSLGLAPNIVTEIYDVIKEVNESGMTMLLVEQNITMALKVSDYAYVMETGEIRTEGQPDEIMKEEHILEAYLGE